MRFIIIYEDVMNNDCMVLWLSSRTPLPYSPKILELFKNPKNLGVIKDADVVSRAGSPACGDMITIYLKIERRNDEYIITDAKFESYGCAANIAATSVLTEMIKGKSLKYAWNISWRDISDEIGGLPAIKFHCAILAVGALRRGIRAYFRNIGYKPDWLPEELTNVEKQVLDEEKAMERLRIMIGVPNNEDRSD